MSITAIPHDPKLPPRTDKCRCMDCGEYFNSSGTFALHRVGDWTDRRCLTVEEMVAKRWHLTETGHWARAKLSLLTVTRIRRADIST